mgnify:CR=1 FL=1
MPKLTTRTLIAGLSLAVLAGAGWWYFAADTAASGQTSAQGQRPAGHRVQRDALRLDALVVAAPVRVQAERVGLAVHGPATSLFVDRATCRVESP